MRDLGKFIVVIGVIATLIGLVMWSGFAPKWLGRLPGDIVWRRDNVTVYIPFGLMILISLILTLLLNLFFRR